MFRSEAQRAHLVGPVMRTNVMREADATTEEKASGMGALGRRLITVPSYFLMFALLTPLLPLLLVLAALVDLVRRVPLVLARTVAFLYYYLLCELCGILAAFALWLAFAAGLIHRDSYIDRNYRLQWLWGTVLARGAFALYSIRVEADDPTELGSLGKLGLRPVILLIRHASVADTILAVLLISARYHLRLRYVLKRELLWDPCLDIVGNRLPNYFVDRSATDTQREIHGVARLMEKLGAGEGVLLYPEGTRFSASKKKRIVERLNARGDAVAADRATALRSVLPPRRGGPVALLRQAAGSDVLFCAHSGFEGAASFWELWRGGLVGAVVRVHFWAIAGDDLPEGDEALYEFLYRQWLRVDEYVYSDTAVGRACAQTANGN